MSTNTALVSLDVSNNPALASLNYEEGLEITTGFSVGHHINVNGDPGVAFYISGTVTKIVSTDETSAAWENGKIWCTNKGSVWYMPSHDELSEIYNNKATLNLVLDFIGATLFSPTDYWSSSEDNKGRPRLIDFNNGGDYSSNQPSKTYRVRAVRAL